MIFLILTHYSRTLLLSFEDRKRDVACRAHLEKARAAPAHTTTISQTHDYVEPEWGPQKENFSGRFCDFE